VPGKDVVSVSESLVKRYPLDKLSVLSTKELAAFPGVGAAKAARLAAAMELGERMFAPKSVAKTFIRSTIDAIEVLKEYAEKKQEYLLALYLNARHELLQKEIVGLGTLNSLRIEPKDIFRHALSTPCASLIIAHNHPSGDPQPSDDDIVFTKRLFEAGEIMGIPMLDHLIISNTGCYSFRNNAVER
jgi:DNA repair protein RadC